MGVKIVLKYRKPFTKENFTKKILNEAIKETPSNEKQKGPRSKEKIIGEIIKKCAIWRKLYHGAFRIDAENAAKSLGISAKSFHYYIFQLRSLYYKF